MLCNLPLLPALSARGCNGCQLLTSRFAAIAGRVVALSESAPPVCRRPSFSAPARVGARAPGPTIFGMTPDPDDVPPRPPRRVGAFQPLPRLPRVLPWAVVSLAVLGALAAAYVSVLLAVSPGVDALRDVQSARPTVLLTADGQPLGSFRREKQAWVPLDAVSPHVVDALIATEDHRFRSHPGIDVRRTAAALWQTVHGDVQGGSTITQQLARNLFPDEIGRSRSLHRKAKELLTALRIERLYTKDEILETYLNTVPFLYNVVGIEMAARTYWNRPARDLDEGQAATLVGMLKGTHYYNPVRHPKRALERRNLVLAQMARHGHLAPARLAALTARPLDVTLTPQREEDGLAPHFTAHVRKWLEDWADANAADLYADGLVVETTLDARLQTAATAAVAEQTAFLQGVADREWGRPALQPASARGRAQARPAAPFPVLWKRKPDLLPAFVRESAAYRDAVAAGAAPDDALRAVLADAEAVAEIKRQRTRLEAGFVAMDPRSGEVRAWVGSRDFAQDQYDHVAQSERQPGSTFKPFVYGAALEAGLDPNRRYVDDPVTIALGDGRVWRPTDMAGTSGRSMTLRDGLVQSKNTITAQVMQEVGVHRTVALARALGVDRSPLDPVPSLALGTSPVTLLEMVTAYASIARQGQRHSPVVVRRILDRHGHVVASFGAETRRAMDADSAVELIDMMRGVVARGTGTMVRTRFGITADVAGKTGTTQNNTDGWFVLMHPELVAGAWVGFNDQRVTMRSNYWGQGGHNAVLLVGDFFRSALAAKAIDAAATFPPSRHPVLPAEPYDPAGDVWEDSDGDAGGGEDPAPWADDSRPIFDERMISMADPWRDEPPKNASELDVLLRLDGAKVLAADR